MWKNCHFTFWMSTDLKYICLFYISQSNATKKRPHLFYGPYHTPFHGRSISKTDPNDFWRIRWQEFHLANQMAEFYPERLIRLWVQHLVNSILSSIFGHWTQTGQVYWGQDIVSPTKKIWGQRIFDDQMPLRNATIIIYRERREAFSWWSKYQKIEPAKNSGGKRP